MAKAVMNAKQAARATQKQRSIIEREVTKNHAKYLLTKVGSAIRKHIRLFGGNIAKINFENLSSDNESVVLLKEILIKKGYNVLITHSYFKSIEDKYSNSFRYEKIHTSGNEIVPERYDCEGITVEVSWL